MRRNALVLAAAVLLGGCGGDGGDTAAPTAVAGPRLASGKAFPKTCIAVPPKRRQVAAFVAGGKAWALSAAGKQLACLFRVDEPGPFAWGPRADRVLLDGLRIEGFGAAPRRAADDVHPVSSSWGRPVGKAVVFVSADRKRLLKAHPGRTDYEDVTPVRKAEYLQVEYHPSGLAFAFILRRGGREELWMSSNTGEKPVRLVHGRLHTSFDTLAFTVDGRALLFAAQHADGHPHVHRIELEAPDSAQTLWTGEPGVLVENVAPAWNTGAIALTAGRVCSRRRALYVDADSPRGRPLVARERRPTHVVGWLTNDTLLVAAGGCGKTQDLYAATITGTAWKLVLGVDAAAVRRPEPTPPPELPARVKVGSGFA